MIDTVCGSTATDVAPRGAVAVVVSTWPATLITAPAPSGTVSGEVKVRVSILPEAAAAVPTKTGRVVPFTMAASAAASRGRPVQVSVTGTAPGSATTTVQVPSSDPAVTCTDRSS